LSAVQVSNIQVTLDGHHYLCAALGQRVPSPYHRRWLLPFLLGPYPGRWRVCTYLSFLAMPLVGAGYLHARGLGGWRLAFAAGLLWALPAHRFALRYPVLLDAPSYVLALLVAWSASAWPWWVTLPLSLVLGATRETGPVFAALWAWSPWPLVGLAAVGWWRPSSPADEAREPWLVHPMREAWKMRCAIGLDGGLYLRPWGAALAGLVAPSWQIVATVIVAHAQLFAAVDAVRLAAWAAPVLVLSAAQVTPPVLWPLALLVTVLHREDRA
jgi:hypothetical protein